MQASRLLSLLMLLQARGRMTAPALAQALEVSTRTILRDIDQLSAAGVPLWGERGRQGGFQLREGWSTQLTGMTEPEAHALLLAGLPGPATELGLGAAAASARLKLVASLPPAWREQADRVGERLHIDPVDWYRSQDQPKFLREVADAVWHARRLRVRYESWRGAVRRELEPLGLVLKAGAWYLVARTAGKEGTRTYRLASLIELDTPGKSFRRPRTFDLAGCWRASAARFEGELRTVPVRVRVSPRGLAWLRNARLQAVPAGAALPTGWQEMSMAVESVEQGALQLMAFGAELEVLAPPALREQVVVEARRLLALHEPRASRKPR
jgi:predicted DNA-binding transcriptional regulator YafY